MSGNLSHKSETGIWTALYSVLLVLMAAVLLFGALLVPHRAISAGNAQVDLSGYERFDKRLVFLDAQWEYFPDTLLISEGKSGEEQGTLVTLPLKGADGLETPQTGKASYRVVLNNVPERTLLMFCIPGYLGKYTLYSNERPYDPSGDAQIMAPNYYEYSMIRERGTVELVIELEQEPFLGIDRIPMFGDHDLLFYNFLLMRVVCFVMFGLMLFAYVILPITYRVFRRVELRLYAAIGGLSLAMFVLETMWFYGFLDIFQKLIPQVGLRLIRMLVEAGIFLLMYRYSRKVHGIKWFRGQDYIVYGLFALCSAAAVLLTVMEIPIRISEWLLAFSVIPVFLMTAGMSVQSVRQSGTPAFISGVGCAALAFGILFKHICPYAEVLVALQMVLPLCMVVSLICWSLLIAASRKRDIAMLEKALAAEQTMAKTQAAFLASQIQPHFLYNTLTTIQELCYTDPMQAADTVVHFSDYLRQNIHFMDYKDKIAFSVELGHIENYMEIQRARFGDAVKFIRNIQFDQFMLPPLTVQPLIENAVSHGIRKSNGTGAVKLTVSRVAYEVVITVEDDGEGFDAENVHSRSLENIRQRIEGAMHGRVEIKSRLGEGSKVTIRFPYKEAVLREDSDSR